jgi:hypothetical protein
MNRTSPIGAKGRTVRGRPVVVLGVLLAGCGRSAPPGVLIGESAHFRLFIDPDLDVPPTLNGMNGLAALETEWADVYTMLQMPDGKIDYYWLTTDHIAAACGTADEGACIWEQSLEIDSPTLPNPHELNHAYMYLRKQRKPIPFLAEGIAEAIACGVDLPSNAGDVAWPPLVAAGSLTSDVYTQGGAFVRYLIRTSGVAVFLRFYEQSPEARDPAEFAANFQNFWGTTVEEVWTAIHDRPAGIVSQGETKICPCSLPSIVPGDVTNDPARTPYWTLPDPAGQTLALAAGVGERVLVKDCAGVRPAMSGQAVLARLDADDPRYVLGPLESATIGSYIADDCAGVAPYPLSPLATVAGDVTIAVSSPPVGAATVYLDFGASFSGQLRQGLQEICSSCGFDQGSCLPLTPGVPTDVAGPLFGRTTLYTSPSEPTLDVVSVDIEIRGQ